MGNNKILKIIKKYLKKKKQWKYIIHLVEGKKFLSHLEIQK
jgi:GTP-binding protein EngB required for normal cell division